MRRGSFVLCSVRGIFGFEERDGVLIYLIEDYRRNGTDSFRYGDCGKVFCVPIWSYSLYLYATSVRVLQ